MDFKNCICGNNNISIGRGSNKEATFFECFSCGRMVGGRSEEEAIIMWNAAIKELKKAAEWDSRKKNKAMLICNGR